MGEANTIALLVVDIQQGLFERATPIYRANELLENVNSLIAKARQAGVPVLHIQHANKGILAEGSAGWQFHTAIQPLASEAVVHKRRANAFEQTDLKARLDSDGVRTLVMTGLVTHTCIKATCLGALDLGYEVVLVSDGHSNTSERAAELVETWNTKLHKKGAELRLAREVEFPSG